MYMEDESGETWMILRCCSRSFPLLWIYKSVIIILQCYVIWRNKNCTSLSKTFIQSIINNFYRMSMACGNHCSISFTKSVKHWIVAIFNVAKPNNITLNNTNSFSHRKTMKCALHYCLMRRSNQNRSDKVAQNFKQKRLALGSVKLDDGEA